MIVVNYQEIIDRHVTCVNTEILETIVTLALLFIPDPEKRGLQVLTAVGTIELTITEMDGHVMHEDVETKMWERMGVRFVEMRMIDEITVHPEEMMGLGKQIDELIIIQEIETGTGIEIVTSGTQRDHDTSDHS
mmetsp:Transcript_2180/g.3150  ORF Transcript_2180/g.3150 Transcript_2180/m.3150 type:complete len:134 (-) Transcript_2180:59-460(-)